MALLERLGLREPAPKPRAMVAAASRVMINDEKEKRRIRQRMQDKWQKDAWAAYDDVGEVKYSANFLGNALAKLRLFVGRRPAPNQAPEPVTDNAIATDALERLKSSAAGHAEILRQTGIQFTVPGECYLIGLGPRPATADRQAIDEDWSIRSIEDLTVDAAGKMKLLHATPDGKAIELDDDQDFILRMWTRHARHAGKADSPLHGVLAQCEELLIIERALRAIAKSRVGNAGFLLVPNEISFGPADPTQDADPSGDGDPFTQEVIKAMITPLREEGSAAAVVPIVVRADSEHLKEFRHVTLERQMDPMLDTRAERALKRLAQGLNVPPEVVLGLADVNHWTAWQIEDSTFRAHVEPLAIQVMDALTAGYLRPAIRTAGGQGEDLVVWFDPSDLVVRPDQEGRALKAHEAILISDEAARRELNYSEEDKPTDEERDRRVEAKRPATRDQGGEQGPPAQEASAAIEPEVPEAAPLEEVVAAATSNLGARLAEIDRSLRQRLWGVADAALQRCLERAGNQLRSKARRNKAITAAIDNAPAHETAAKLGPSLVASLGVNDGDLVKGAFDGFRQKFEQWAATAQRRALALVPGLTADERETVEAQQERDLIEAGEWLVQSMEALARQRLYDPSPEAPEMGEVDDSISVPFSIIREAVARAGGSAGPEASTRLAAGIGIQISATEQVLGLATGWLLRRIFGEHGLRTEGYRWVYGEYPRSRPFEPHEDLDGLEFQNFDDESLTNSNTFPGFAYYFPGDHDGCVCDFEPVVVQIAA